ncbi:MAG: HepT-like ribonuclease domain-containing protein [Thermoplasmata archaeon]
MTSKSMRDKLRVTAMTEAAEEAKRDAAGGKAMFLLRGLAQKAVLLDLIHFTESAEKTSPAFKNLNPRVPWERLSRLRNRGLVHEYVEVDLEDLWTFVRDELPGIRRLLDRAVLP